MRAPSRLTFRPRPTSSIKRFTVCVIRVVRLGHPFCFLRSLRPSAFSALKGYFERRDGGGPQRTQRKLAMLDVPMIHKITVAFIACIVLASTALAQTRFVHQPIVVTITQAEDERRWSNDLMQLLSHQSPAIRKRAALAAGRIGDEGAVKSLTYV